MEGVVLVVARAAEGAGWLTIAITIVPSSQPQARTTCVRTKHLRITLNSEIEKKTEVTIKIALLRLSSRPNPSNGTIIPSMMNEQSAWGSYPHLDKGRYQEN